MKELEEMRESPAGSSQLSLFAQCPRSWFYKYIRGFRHVGPVSALNLGSATHEAQEVFYLTGSLDKALARGQEILIKSDYDLESNEMKRLNATLPAWAEAYGFDDLNNESVVAVEHELNLKLFNGYTMTVRLDALMIDEQGLFIRDTKSTGGNVSQTMRQYMHSPQPVLYIEAVNQSDIAQKETLQGWRTDIIASRVNKASVRVDCHRSDLVMPTADRIKDVKIYYTDLTDRIASAIIAYESGTPEEICFPANISNCINYNRLCDHSAHCHQRPTNTPGGFELDPWLKDRTVLNTFDCLKEN